MREAKAREVREHAIPLFTARLKESEITKWIPVKFKEFTNADEGSRTFKGRCY